MASCNAKQAETLSDVSVACLMIRSTPINSSDGSLQAHKAILAATSPAWSQGEKVLNNRHWRYDTWILYGTISQAGFWKHRLALLSAANKYDIADLKDTCEESLLEDINTGNVLVRLQDAWLYQLDKLKKTCVMYLLDFGRIYDLEEEMNDFFRHAHTDLVVEMFQELLAASSKPTLKFTTLNKVWEENDSFLSRWIWLIGICFAQLSIFQQSYLLKKWVKNIIWINGNQYNWHDWKTPTMYFTEFFFIFIFRLWINFK